MKTVRAQILVLVAMGALVVPATALASSFSAHLTIGTHQPRVGNQRITVTATRGRTKLAGTVHYRFLYNGSVVSTKPGGSFRHGVYHDTLAWPKAAVGHTITLQVVVHTRYGTKYLNWWIKVKQ